MDRFLHPEPPTSALVASILGLPKPNWKRIGTAVATGGISETARAMAGEDSIYDPVLDAAGMGIDKAGARPDADNYFGTAEGTTAENLRRAYEMADKAGAYQTQGRIRDPGPIVAPTVTARQTDGPMGTTAHDAGAIERASVERVDVPRDLAIQDPGAAARVTGRQAGNIERAGPAAQMGPAATTRTTGVDFVRDETGASQMLLDAATGNVPSRAEALMDKGLDANSRKQRAMAAAAKGSERRGARRAAMLAIGDQGAQAIQDAAALRADEQAKARDQYSGYSQRSLAMRQEANNLKAQIDAAAARGDMEAANRMRAQQAELDTQAAQFDASAQNIRTEADTGRLARADELNATADNARAIDRATLRIRTEEGNRAAAMGAQDANAGRATAASMADAAAANARAESLVRRQDESDMQYAARVQAWQEANAQRDQAAQTTNAANSLTGQTVTGQLGQRADEGNAGIQQTDQQIRDRGVASGLGIAGSAADQQLKAAGIRYGADMAQYQEEIARERQQRNGRRQLVLEGGMAYATGGASLGAPGLIPKPGGAGAGPLTPVAPKHRDDVYRGA